jgi:hypothetical protein
MEPAFARSRHRSTPSRGVSSAEANRAMCHRNSAHQDRVLKFQPTFSGKSLDGTTCPNCGRKPDEEAYSGLCYIFGVSYDHHRSSLEGSAMPNLRGCNVPVPAAMPQLPFVSRQSRKTQEIGSYTIFGGRPGVKFGGRPGVKNRSTTRRLPITARR